MNFHVLGPLSLHLYKLSLGHGGARGSPSLAQGLLQFLLLQLIFLQQIPDVLEGGFHIREHT